MLREAGVVTERKKRFDPWVALWSQPYINDGDLDRSLIERCSDGKED